MRTVDKEKNLANFVENYRRKIAATFVDAWDDGGPVAAGRAMREVLPDVTIEDDEALAEFKPYIRAEFESRGYTFDEEVEGYEEEITQ
jgi:hypothetical protein